MTRRPSGTTVPEEVQDDLWGRRRRDLGTDPYTYKGTTFRSQIRRSVNVPPVLFVDTQSKKETT